MTLRSQPAQQWCEKHWAPIRDSYVEGGDNSRGINSIAAQLYIMATVMGDEEIQQRAGFKETGENRADPSILNALMAEISPICCWLGDDAMKQLYEDCRNDRPDPPCAKCGVLTFPGAYNRKKKETVYLHSGGAWSCEQFKALRQLKGGQ